jgi:hypothetical protein
MIRRLLTLAERYVTAIERSAAAGEAVATAQREHMETYRRQVDRAEVADATLIADVRELRHDVDRIRRYGSPTEPEGGG